MGIVLPLILIIIIVFLGWPSHATVTKPVLLKPVTVPVKGADFGLPVRLKIPAIQVDAAVEYVGLTAKGAMDVPSRPDVVGWFNQSRRPGEVGSAVIDGHFGFKNGSVFDNLHKLQPGDKIYVEDFNGSITTFIVRESRSYEPLANASDVFNSSDGNSHLNLITCEGVWSKSQKNYSKRLIVFTDKEIE